jgi:hypothetical protein
MAYHVFVRVHPNVSALSNVLVHQLANCYTTNTLAGVEEPVCGSRYRVVIHATHATITEGRSGSRGNINSGPVSCSVHLEFGTGSVDETLRTIKKSWEAKGRQ